jgi:uncharacterized protein YjeT (DUF2065 family)
MWTTVVMAIALMLVIEGLLPFIAPARWREVLARLVQLNDGQIRFFGLSLMIVGLGLLAAAA